MLRPTRKNKAGFALLVILLILSMIVPMNTFATDNIGKFDKNQQFAINYLNDQAVQKKIAEINDAIWSYAELGLEEYNTSALLVNYLEKEGFKVEKGVAGMPTAFVATYTNGPGPVVGVLGELDALPMLSQESENPIHTPVTEVNGSQAPGHGCTHNTMGTAAAATVVAVKEAMEAGKFTGTIKMFGSPAEETVISRPFMVYAGVFKDVDVVIDNHGGGSFGASHGVGSNGIFSFAVTFTGRTAHSAGSPWDGKSALDAVQLMNISTEFLREHLFYTYRMHHVTIFGGEAPNVVPDNATTWYFVRDTDQRIKADFDRVIDCAKAAALATGTTFEITPYTAIHQCYRNENLANLLVTNMNKVGYPQWTEKEQNMVKKIQEALGSETVGLYDNSKLPEKANGPSPVFTGGGSSDIGEVSLNVPLATLNFPSGAPGVSSHHWSLPAVTGTTVAHKGLIAGAKVMAITAIDLMTDSKKLAEIKAEFNESKKKYSYNYDANGNFVSYLPYVYSRSGKYTYNPAKYKFFVPEGKKVAPPLGFLKGQMDKYRAEMSKKYMTPSWYDGPPMKME